MRPSSNLTREEAIALFNAKWWEGKSARDIATFQLHEAKLCMPFEKFHAAVEEALGRPVYTHEFGLDWEGLVKELEGDLPAPTTEEIVDLIPAEKRLIVDV